MRCEVIKILASGYKRFMWLEICGVVICKRIDDDLYKCLKTLGVPTAQSLRGKHVNR